jgi:pilus assembly protein Flp/PilA
MKSIDIVPRINVAVSRATIALRDRQLKGKQKGLTTVEYAVAGALVAATVVLAFTNLGAAVEAVIVDLTTAIS